MPGNPIKEAFKMTVRIARLAYYALLGITALVILVFFTNVLVYLCSHVSEECIKLIDYIFRG